MDVYTVYTGTCGWGGGTPYSCYQYQDASGNCLRAGTNYVVKIENGGCAPSDHADWWAATGDYRYKSLEYDDSMLTHGNVGGYNVWHATPQSADWFRWSFN
jgi:hypothetical protein